MSRLSAFVTDWALLSIKSIGRDAEHIIALDAHAVDDGTDNGARLGRFVQATRRRSGALLRHALGRHRRILTRHGVTSRERADGIPGIQKTHPLEVRDGSIQGRCED